MGKNKCLDRLISVWGWTFDVVTILLSVSDIVSDVMVCYQFYGDGEMTWFGLTAAALINSNLIFTIFTVEIVLRGRDWKLCGRTFGRWFWYPVIFPIAQVMPICNYFLQTMSPTRTVVKTTWQEIRADGSAAATEELDAAASSATLLERLDGALHSHIQSHGMFYVETVVEAIPQSIIQLLAITLLGKATPVQIWSMSLSVFSIVSKAYVVSHAFDVSVFFYKFLLVAHDIFSLFYVFSSVVAKDTPSERHIDVINVNMTTLSTVWLWKVVVLAGYTVLSASGIGIGIVITELRRSYSSIKCKDVGFACFFVCMCVLGFIPAMLAAESMKLAWILVALSMIEPPMHTLSAQCALFSFVRRGDWEERVRFINVHTANLVLRGPQRGTEILRLARNAREVCAKEDFHHHDLFWEVWAPFRAWRQRTFINNKCQLRADVVVGVVVAVFWVLYVCGQIISFVYPFVNTGMYYGTLNGLQRMSFFSMAAVLCLCVVLLPRMYMYILFLLETRIAHQSMLSRRAVSKSCELGTPAQYASRLISAYHTPPHVQALHAAIPTDVLARDLVDVMGDFMDPSAINMTQLSIEECKLLRTGMPLKWQVEPDTAT